MEEDIQKVAAGAKKAWPVLLGWVGGISALIGLFASIAGGVTWFVAHQKQKTERQAKITLAEAQTNQGEYQAAVQTYAAILKDDPLDRAVLDQQLATTMQWVEDFHVVSSSDQNSDQIAASALDQVLPILDGGLSRTKGIAAADVQAHIGWAHWMNNKMADREVGPAAEQNLRAALATDPTNAYANGMLGNWLLQNGGSLEEAIRDFKVALSTGKARPFIRSLQFGGLIYHDERGARAELIKAANDMRKAHEPIHAATKSRLLSFCYTVAINDPADLAESLSSVPTDESWQTYLWIDDAPRSSDVQRTDHEFIQANLLELSGKRQESLIQFRQLQKEGPANRPTMKDAVDRAIARLSHG
jgi:tetratricopeptide (TPR) repeat protein